MSIPISQLTTGVPNGDVELPGTNPLDTTSSLNGTTFKYLLVDVLQYILNAQGFTTYASCVVATTSALNATYANGTAGVGATLTNAGAQSALAIDGVTLTVNDRVLVKNQASTYENGIYVVTNAGSASSNWILTRATDYNEPSEIIYLGVVAITQGASQAGLIFQESAQGPFVIGTSPITFGQLQLDVSLLPSASPANKLLRSDGTYWVQSTNAALNATDALTQLTELGVDNISINGNTIASTDTNGNLILTPNALGNLVLDGLNWPQADGANGQVISTNGTGQLGWSDVASVTLPTTDKSIAIFNGTGGAIESSTLTVPSAGVLSGINEIYESSGDKCLVLEPTSSPDFLINFKAAVAGRPVNISAVGLGAPTDCVFGISPAGDAGVTLFTQAVTNPALIIAGGTGAQVSTRFLITDAPSTNQWTMPNLTGTMVISGAGQSVTFGQLNVDNVQINGNTISSTDTNGDLILTPNGTGDLVLDGQAWPQTSGSSGQYLQTDGAGQTSWQTIPGGSVNPGTVNQLGWYASTGDAISGLATANNGILVTSAGGVPSIGNSVGADLTINSVKVGRGASAIATNTVVGNGAGSSFTTGNHNTAVGWSSLDGVTTGANNSAYGYSSGISGATGAVTLTTGGSNTFVGYRAASNANDAVGTIAIGADAVAPKETGITSSDNGPGIAFGSDAFRVGFRGDGQIYTGGTGRGYWRPTINGNPYLMPLFADGTTTASAVMVTDSAGSPILSSSMTNGQVLIGSTGSTPVAATLTGAGGISITNAAGSITISGSGVGFSWTEVTGTTQSMAVNNGYIASNASQVVLTLPATAIIGDTIKVQGKGTGGWKVAQNNGQLIHFNSSTSTLGISGYIESTQRYNSVELVCITNNNEWAVNSASGNLTVF